MGHNCQTLSWHVYVRNGPTVLADPTGEYYRDKSCDSNATWRSLLSTGMKSIRMGTLKTFLCCLENRGAISSATKQTWTQAFNWKTTGPTIYCGDDAYCKLLGAVGTGVACGYPPNMKDVRLCNPALNPYGSIGQYACDWPNVECCILHETVHIFMGLPGHANAAVKQCWPYQRCPKGGAAWT